MLSGNGRIGHRREGKVGTERGSEVGWVEEVRTSGWSGCPRHSPTHLGKASRDSDSDQMAKQVHGEAQGEAGMVMLDLSQS